MPYSIGSKGSYGCSGYPAIKNDTKEVMGCHKTRKEAAAQIYAINRSEKQGFLSLAKIVNRGKDMKKPFKMQEIVDEIKDMLEDMVNPTDTVAEIQEEFVKFVDLKPEEQTDEEISKTYNSDNEEEDKWDNLNKACWSGYEQRGMKDKNGRKVPNCVPIEKLNDETNEEPADEGRGKYVYKSIWNGVFLK